MASSDRISAALSLDSLGDDARAAFDLAADAGYAAIAFATNQPELRPADLGVSARRHLQRILAGKNLRIDALRIAGPRGGLADPASVERAIENAQKGIALAFDLGIKTISVNTGMLAAEAQENSAVHAAARQIAEEADRAGVAVAFTAEGGAALEQLIRHLAWDRACANLETAREIAGGHDPVETLQRFRGAVAQVTLADAISGGNRVRAVEVGHGQIDLPALLRSLRENDFHGPLVVDVRDLPDAVHGAKTAAEALRNALR